LVDLVATASFYADWALHTLLNGSQEDSLEFLNIVRVLRLFKLAQHSSGLKILIQTFKASARVFYSSTSTNVHFFPLFERN
jgi:potassium voltage-gated channel Shaw-related subfamily C protein